MDNKGIQKAVERTFLGASWQMCNVHLMRAVLKNIPKKNKAEVAYELRDALEGENKMQVLANKLGQLGYHKSAETIERFRFDLGITKSFLERIGEGPRQRMDWRESIKS